MKGHKKLKIFLATIALLVVGFFLYKYAYIFIERQKYNQAEQAISRVADDLRAQGIDTTPYKSCEHAQVKYGAGFLTCSVGIVYEGNEEIIGVSIKEPLEKFIASIDKQKFESFGTSDELNPTSHPIVVGTSNYSLSKSKLGCGLSYDKFDDSEPPYTLRFGCGKYSRFLLF